MRAAQDPDLQSSHSPGDVKASTITVRSTGLNIDGKATIRCISSPLFVQREGRTLVRFVMAGHGGVRAPGAAARERFLRLPSLSPGEPGLALKQLQTRKIEEPSSGAEH
jgi:hypothetical protein